MALQTQVYNHVAPAIEGMVEAGNDAHFSAVSYKTGDAVAVGHFVFLGDDGTVSNAGTTVLGILPLVRAYATAGLAATMSIAKGEDVTPLVRGHICVKTTTAAKVGQAVFASKTDGSVGTTEGAATNFVVEKVFGDGAAGDLIIITNQVAA